MSPTDRPRHLDWITLTIMVIIALVGAIYFVAARPDKIVAGHLHDELEPTGAELCGESQAPGD